MVKVPHRQGKAPQKVPISKSKQRQEATSSVLFEANETVQKVGNRKGNQIHQTSVTQFDQQATDTGGQLSKISQKSQQGQGTSDIWETPRKQIQTPVMNRYQVLTNLGSVLHPHESEGEKREYSLHLTLVIENILSWNVRGLNASNKQKEIKLLCNEEKVRFGRTIRNQNRK